MATILKLAIKNIYPNYQHYTDNDPSVNTQPHISCLKNRSRTKWKNVSKERLKIPKRYSEAGLWELSKGLNIFYEKGPLYCASVIIT